MNDRNFEDRERTLEELESFFFLISNKFYIKKG
jgi:hypothetical protein